MLGINYVSKVDGVWAVGDMASLTRFLYRVDANHRSSIVPLFCLR